METHDLIQGSSEWHAYRKNHWNASDAPAMLGCSPYKTRTQLLHEVWSGMAADIDTFTQTLFDAGHRYEALARPIAEKIIGQDLYPVTGSNGKFSASFDGLTMDESINFEHKSLNDVIRAANNAADLPKYLRVQMEQQHMISGAEKTLFMASKWDASDNLVEEVHHWYTPESALADEIVAGWAQFEVDLLTYQPPIEEVKPIADTILHLPALVVQARGEVVASNLPQFQVAAHAFIANIKTDLSTDDDFVNADATVKFCEKVESDLEHAKNATIAQTASIDEVLRIVSQIQEQVRQKRLQISKLIDTKKAQIKETILSDGKCAYAAHVAELEKEITPIRLSVAAPDFVGAMKGKRTLATLQNAVDTALANGKIAANAAAQEVRGKLAWIKATADEYMFLFHDLQAIIGKAKDDFELLVRTRIEQHTKAEELKADALRKKANEEVVLSVWQSVAEGARINSYPESTNSNVQAIQNRILDANTTLPTGDQIVECLMDNFDISAKQAIECLRDISIYALSESWKYATK